MMALVSHGVLTLWWQLGTETEDVKRVLRWHFQLSHLNLVMPRRLGGNLSTLCHLPVCKLRMGLFHVGKRRLAWSGSLAKVGQQELNKLP